MILLKYSELTSEFLRDNYLFGIPLEDTYGNKMKEGLLDHYLKSAIEQTQRAFQITIQPIEVTENYDYYDCDYNSWGFIQLNKKPVKEVQSVAQYFGNQKCFDIPLDWVQLRNMSGTIQLFPMSGSSGSMILTQNGSFIPFTVGMYQYAPSIWRVSYVAGFEDIPEDLVEYIMKRASIGILQVWGDLIIGAGIANQTVSIDGLSQSIGTTQSPEFSGAGARIKNYMDDLKLLEQRLRDTYVGINMVVV